MKNEALADFQGKIVVVSGASSGIGRAVAVMLAGHGARLILIGRERDRLEETAKALPSKEYLSVSLDLRNLGEIMPQIQKARKEFGAIYGLCHAAGVVDMLPLNVSTIDRLLPMFDVKLFAGIELARAVSRRDTMDPEGGSILFIYSIYGIIGKPGETGYSATKGAITSAARTMAVELAKRNIRVNILSPGLVRTDMTEKAFSMLSPQQVKDIEKGHPLGPGKPEDVARAAVFLLSPQNRWITGTDLVIDGGYTAQ